MSPFAKSVLEYIAFDSGVSVDQLLGRGRHIEIAWPRQEAMTIFRFARYSAPRIGRMFDGRDHTTVLHAERRIRETAPERYRELELVANALMQAHGLSPDNDNSDKIVKSFQAEQLMQNVELDFLKGANASLRHQVAALKRENVRLKSTLSRFDKAYGVMDLTDRIEALEEENRWLKDRLPDHRLVAGSR